LKEGLLCSADSWALFKNRNFLASALYACVKGYNGNCSGGFATHLFTGVRYYSKGYGTYVNRERAGVDAVRVHSQCVDIVRSLNLCLQSHIQLPTNYSLVQR
jgi:hypothetical protein